MKRSALVLTFCAVLLLGAQAQAVIIEEGADAFISKPVAAENVLKIIRTFLSKG